MSRCREIGFWTGCAALLGLVRFCHLNVLWVDEAYGMAGARRLLEGATLYRDVWFDKPPLYAWVYLPWGATPGWGLRIAGTLFALLCCWLAGRAAAQLFSEREGKMAAAGMAFFLSFDHPVALLPMAPDLLLAPFALAMVWALAAGSGAIAAVVAAAALLANGKALLLAPLLPAWLPGQWRRMTVAYAAGVAAAWMAAGDWWEPVWVWGRLYAADTFLVNPGWEGLRRTANWAAFHAALVVGAGIYFWRRQPHYWRLALWLALGIAMVCAGWRFFPRYYFALLPVMTLAAARGVFLLPVRVRVAVLTATLVVPAVRFGSRHLATWLERPSSMRDLSLWSDCREAAEKLHGLAAPGDTLLVWGYRPELNVLAALPGGTRFLDSQPLTGVLADRHLTQSRPTAPQLAARHRAELRQRMPTFVVDGLGPLNPALAITSYPDLRDWFASYQFVAETKATRIYRRLQ
jgi:hypothetical protein